VHYGSTSQDVLDTALVLSLKPCLTDADRVFATSVGRPNGRCASSSAEPSARSTPSAANA
jgi:hypothetical protein